MSIIDEIAKAVFGFLIIGFIGWALFQLLILNKKLSDRIHEQNDQIAIIKLENVNLKASQTEIQKQFTVLTNLSDEQRKELVASKLSERLAVTDTELTKLKDLMLQTPEKAVKLERVQLKQEAEFKVLNGQIASLKDQYNTLQNLLYIFVGFIISVLLYLWRQSHVQNMHNKRLWRQ
ncbi:hypothetical protein [Shewanella waksmanii]|uniref:hypothetical protein n=1 Tax=Shewanella waksmanii TaxID=213783 RepID=UPI00048C6B09|nr:hypothetical protein [Shewanella waksmanii]